MYVHVDVKLHSEGLLKKENSGMVMYCMMYCDQSNKTWQELIPTSGLCPYGMVANLCWYYYRQIVHGI